MSTVIVNGVQERVYASNKQVFVIVRHPRINVNQIASVIRSEPRGNTALYQVQAGHVSDWFYHEELCEHPIPVGDAKNWHGTT
ncbi:unnamed protein product [Somion occarium]|uniref:Uncharacterized protein n=1 Tax=Somion occarium TaxID=3059160 RepID=A0ABP1DT80_9APHY